MKFNQLLSCLVFITGCLALTNSYALTGQEKTLHQFIDKMVEKHHFDRQRLKQLFTSVEIKDSILKAMKRPAEALPWHKYRNIFLTASRIQGGVEFWRQHESVLTEVEQQTGVPAQIIVAIIGVETRYGGNTGHYRVIDALSTLGFAYPKRSTFFLGELEHFLLLCREQHIDPLQPTGSYAGAMGWPQFMPSSYRSYAADFDGDNKKDIWDNPADVIASIANYFVRHHWQAGEAIAFQVAIPKDKHALPLQKGLKPNTTVAKLKSLAIQVPARLPDSQPVRLLQFEMEKGWQYWIGLPNFYVITRYNHSPLYAMAVFQLSQEIAFNKSRLSRQKPVF